MNPQGVPGLARCVAMEFAWPFTVLDGGLSTALEAAGHDLDHDLWTARLLVEEPEAIVRAHLAYLEAGAEILITASYQASIAGFMSQGLSRVDAVALIGLTTELGREAVTRFLRGRSTTDAPLVAASVGPYGATLADGSEYRGDYSIGVGLLTDFHTERLEILVASGPDLLACETIPSALEAEAVLNALHRLPATPAWFSFSCRNGAETSAGDAIEDAVELVAASDRVVAVGVNCTAPALVGELLERIGRVTDLPLVAYANSGQQWDALHNCWVGPPTPADDPALLDRWLAAGARLVGACCGVGPEGIARLRAARDTLPPDGEAA